MTYTGTASSQRCCKAQGGNRSGKLQAVYMARLLEQISEFFFHYYFTHPQRIKPKQSELVKYTARS